MDIRYTHPVPSELLYQPHSLYRNNNNNNNNIQYPLPLRPSWSTNTTKTRNVYNNNINNNDLVLPINKISPQRPIHSTSKKNNRYKQGKNKSSTSFPYVQGVSFPDNSQHFYSSNANHYSNFDKIAHHKQKNMEQRSHTTTATLINEEYRIPQNKNKPILKTISSNNYQYEKNITGNITNNMNTIQYTKNNNSGPSKYDSTSKMKGKKPLSINTQSYNKPRSIPVTANNNAVVLENKSIQPIDQIRVQRKPIPILQQKSKKSTSVPNPIMDYNSFNPSLQQNNNNNNNNNIDLSQISRSPSKNSQWKVSGQHDGLLLRSPLSSTPPSLLYESSSTTTSTTHSSSLESQHYQLNNNNNNSSTSNINKKSSYEHIKPTTPTSSISSSHGYNSKHTNKKKATSKGHKKSSSLSSSSISSLSTRSRYSFNNDYESQTSSSTERPPRRYSQGDCHPSSPLSHTETNYPHIQQRASTPKLRRVHSAKPCIKRINEFQPNNNNNNNINNNSSSSTNDIINNVNNDSNDHYDKKNNKSDKKNPTLSSSFWNPRTEKDILPVKRTLSKRIRGLLLPQKSKLDEACKDRHVVEYQWSVARPMTPTDEISFFNDAFLEDPENGIMDNPFYMISQSWNIVDQPGLHFNEHDFIQMDTYATSVQQRGPSLTPKILTQKFLVRPYRRDLYRLRIIFIWILQNISIIDQRVHEDNYHYHQNNSTEQNNLSSETITNNSNNNNNNNRSGGKKLSLRRRLSHRHSTSSLQDSTEELDMPSIDVLHGDGLLPEGGGDVESFDDWLLSESAHQVLLNRTCTSSIGMANLFCDMAIAAGFQDAKVVYGYLRAPKDSIKSATMDSQDDQYDDDSLTLIQNHAWCCVKVEGEYRFVDCWLASPSQPQNHNKIETHWFLTKPKDMIFTHYPQEYEDQFLEPRINLSTFFALPYVWSSFFLHHIQFIRYDPFAISMVDDQVCHLSFRVDFNVICYAYVEVDYRQNNNNNSNINNGMIRALAQCRTITLENGESERIYKIKAVLPAGYSHGWLKIYTNNTKSSTASMPLSSSTSATTTASTTITTSSLPPSSASSSSLPSSSLTLSPLMETLNLALCFQLTHHQHYHSTSSSDNMKSSFEFVQLHPCKYEFYVQEPQCYHLYPLQTYNFLIRGGDTHHKLAIRSPSGKLYKLMSYPQEHSYDGSITISEIGKWSLIYLLHHAGGWSLIATWECKGQ